MVIGVLAVLAGLLLPALASVRARSRAVFCLGQMRELGLATSLHLDDRNEVFPRSTHSAFANGEQVWALVLAPRLGVETADWQLLLDTLYHCPGDERQGLMSYAQNVYFELGPEDDYEGKPATWRRRRDVPRPSATVLFAENNSGADHVMPNFWTTAADAVDVASTRHRGLANYTFVDGHAAAHRLDAIYEPRRNVDRWHPLRAQ